MCDRNIYLEVYDEATYYKRRAFAPEELQRPLSGIADNSGNKYISSEFILDASNAGSHLFITLLGRLFSVNPQLLSFNHQ